MCVIIFEVRSMIARSFYSNLILPKKRDKTIDFYNSFETFLVQFDPYVRDMSDSITNRRSVSFRIIEGS